MPADPTTLPRRTVGEWTLRSARTYAEPFADVAGERAAPHFTHPCNPPDTLPR